MFILKAVFFELLLLGIVQVPVLGYWFWRCFYSYFYLYDGRRKALISVEVVIDSGMVEDKRRQRYILYENNE